MREEINKTLVNNSFTSLVLIKMLSWDIFKRILVSYETACLELFLCQKREMNNPEVEGIFANSAP